MAEIVIGQAVEVCCGRLKEGAGVCVKRTRSSEIHLNELDGAKGHIRGVSGSEAGQTMSAVVEIQSRSEALCGRVTLPAEVLKTLKRE